MINIKKAQSFSIIFKILSLKNEEIINICTYTL